MREIYIAKVVVKEKSYGRNNTMIKRIVSVLIIIVFSISSYASVFANGSGIIIDDGMQSLHNDLINFSLVEIIDYVEDNDISDENLLEILYQREINQYANDEEFLDHYMQDPEEAYGIIEQNVDNQFNYIKNQLGNQTNAGNDTNAWVDPILLMQKNSYYCGPCSALQAIAIYGGYVAGNTNNNKQDTLANQMGTDSSGTTVYNVTSTLNSYVPGYSYKKGSTMTDFSFKYTVLNSLINEKAPILHARTQYISYYGGHSSGHYICVTAINNQTDMIRLSDCNNNQNYYGTRSIPRSEAFASITASNRYLISSSML